MVDANLSAFTITFASAPGSIVGAVSPAFDIASVAVVASALSMTGAGSDGSGFVVTLNGAISSASTSSVWSGDFDGIDTEDCAADNSVSISTFASLFALVLAVSVGGIACAMAGAVGSSFSGSSNSLSAAAIAASASSLASRSSASDGNCTLDGSLASLTSASDGNCTLDGSLASPKFVSNGISTLDGCSLSSSNPVSNGTCTLVCSRFRFRAVRFSFRVLAYFSSNLLSVNNWLILRLATSIRRLKVWIVMLFSGSLGVFF